VYGVCVFACDAHVHVCTCTCVCVWHTTTRDSPDQLKAKFTTQIAFMSPNSAEWPCHCTLGHILNSTSYCSHSQPVNTCVHVFTTRHMWIQHACMCTCIHALKWTWTELSMLQHWYQNKMFRPHTMSRRGKHKQIGRKLITLLYSWYCVVKGMFIHLWNIKPVVQCLPVRSACTQTMRYALHLALCMTDLPGIPKHVHV
jgi:hypothetical protein